MFESKSLGISYVPTLLLNRFPIFLSSTPLSTDDIQSRVGLLISHCCGGGCFCSVVEQGFGFFLHKSAYSIRNFIITSGNDQRREAVALVVDYNLQRQRIVSRDSWEFRRLGHSIATDRRQQSIDYESWDSLSSSGTGESSGF